MLELWREPSPDDAFVRIVVFTVERSFGGQVGVRYVEDRPRGAQPK